MKGRLWVAPVVVVVTGLAIAGLIGGMRTLPPPASMDGRTPPPTEAEESGLDQSPKAAVRPALPPPRSEEPPARARRPFRPVKRSPASRPARTPSPQSPPSAVQQTPIGAQAPSEAIPPAEDGPPASATGPAESPAAGPPVEDGGLGVGGPTPTTADVGAPPSATMSSPALPVLRAPRLTDAPAAYPTAAHVVALDRATITPALRRVALEGRAVLKVLVRADGSVAGVDVQESSGSLVLDGAAVGAARTWRFAPATRDGQPIDAWAVIPVRFVVP